mmetsp:Transcript_3818/g.8625  ORF Transcript_3818/g.8625 Transcript_3818/m.8625 type:complete len:166 (+) Transcript_3818:429-926(+)
MCSVQNAEPSPFRSLKVSTIPHPPFAGQGTTKSNPSQTSMSTRNAGKKSSLLQQHLSIGSTQHVGNTRGGWVKAGNLMSEVSVSTTKVTHGMSHHDASRSLLFSLHLLSVAEIANGNLLASFCALHRNKTLRLLVSENMAFLISLLYRSTNKCSCFVAPSDARPP